MGPIISGFASESSLGWRSSFWIMTIFSFILAVLNFFITRETYAPILLRKRASKLRKQHPHLHFVSKLDIGKDVRVKQRFKDNIFRPFQLLFRESIVSSLSIYMAYLYALLYMCFASYPIVFQQGRGWSPGIGGLAFLGIAVGTILGNIYYYYLNGRYTHALHKHQHKFGLDAHLPPEARLPGAIAGAVIIPIGLLIFAFTTDPSIHWIVPIASEAPFGAGQLLIFLCSTNYVLDAYTEYGASAMAANAILRSILGAVFPLFVSVPHAAPQSLLADAPLRRQRKCTMLWVYAGLPPSQRLCHCWASLYPGYCINMVRGFAKIANTAHRIQMSKKSRLSLPQM